MKTFLYNLWDNIKIIAITIIITLLFLHFVAQLAVTCGNSMNNTLNNGDLLIMEKITTRFLELKRYDVVVFDSENEKHENFIKRVIGLPGETVRIDQDGVIYINGNKLSDDKYGAEQIKDPGRAKTEIKLGENEYFVMGDNRNESLDSRFDEVGNVRIDQIKGKVMFSIYPIKKIY